MKYGNVKYILLKRLLVNEINLELPNPMVLMVKQCRTKHVAIKKFVTI